ncbi:branched-chain amino acid ABC transporter permease [Mycolicibacterium sp. YH-1]|uniref:branched-chain amino acid ABC transporter permease n=1 Tax=Mycolicibacterium sp. YH-1 TaxID=2908837 RepID=UPI001F4BF3E7|nr:branched-chain amino acid ABC transporter permease [Mycolicibacterium sp. YH-1]UNB50871.1 branched-chain amino acid ABC transporter permease [Mycolicibacterium sp. YH-1]
MSTLLILGGLITLMGIYAVAALALNLQFGVGGMVNFGVAAFFGVGAYAYALTVMPAQTGSYTYILGLGLPWWSGAIIGGLASALLALIVGSGLLRVGGDYLAVVALALAEMTRQLFINQPAIANGARGLLDAPVPSVDFIPGRAQGLFIAAIVVAVLGVTFLLFRRVTRSAFGRSLLAINQNEAVARSLGVNVYAVKLKAFVFAAFFMGLAGVMYVWYLSILTPAFFNVNITFTVFIALIIGGMGSNAGAVLGAVVLLGLREGLTYVQVGFISSELMASLQDALQGLVLIVILLFWPGGLFKPRLAIYPSPGTAFVAPAVLAASTAGGR